MDVVNETTRCFPDDTSRRSCRAPQATNRQFFGGCKSFGRKVLSIRILVSHLELGILHAVFLVQLPETCVLWLKPFHYTYFDTGEYDEYFDKDSDSGRRSCHACFLQSIGNGRTSA